ncbi:hypothetical protein [Pseudoalteromonas luteoviolacea]|uniref:hypothetical protein n=1 Tax=Pseudoalteromonas luteoviolacea TaxID=43657 RepID=UPI001154B18B|nr:hypothetical protein [Pseudoalteromonas luteoviolacea]TQF71849.1 hypothetical protein FLM44_12510 [Pseudoalteromonas luteoviolacea]
MSTQAKTLEQLITELHITNGDLVSANNQLTTTVTGKISDIDTKVAQAKSELDTKFMESQNGFNEFMGSANQKFQGTGVTVDAIVTAAEGVNIAPQVHELYEAGKQNILVSVPANTTCFWDSQINIPHGRGLTIRGVNKETSQVKFRAFHRQYEDKTYHYIAPIRLSAGANVRVHTVTLEQEILEGATAAPYQHGMFSIPSYNTYMGDIGLYLSECIFKTYDCIVHPEGVGTGYISVVFVSCELRKVPNPGWFSVDHNCGWLGTGSWSHQGRYLSCTKHACKQTADTETEKVCDIIWVWASGSDASNAKFTQVNSSSHFRGAI